MNAAVLQTQRLILRPMESGDLDELVALFSDPRVMRYIGPVRSREETQAWLGRTKSHWQTHGFGNRAVVSRDSGEFIGRCGVIWGPLIAESPELAYTYLPVYWGQGLATEAAQCMLDHAFNDLRLATVSALADRDNTASIRVIEKLGMTYRESRLIDGHDVLIFARAKEAGASTNGGDARPVE